MAMTASGLADARPVLVLNAGSSSLKFAVFPGTGPLIPVAAGVIERIGSAGATLMVKPAEGGAAERSGLVAADHVSALAALLPRLTPVTGPAGFGAVGHRVVHGGPNYHEPQRVDPAMLGELRRIRSFDPEHLPAEIALMEEIVGRFPDLPQFACFDPAFHWTMPRVAVLLPIPRRYEAQGVRRYGFHGLSYAFLLEELARVAGAQAAQGRVLLAHLGNGASLAAVHGGRSVDTTMAFTPAAGLVMGTRSGDLDPGLAAYLARSEQMTAAQFDHMVNHDSGLLGVSETSSDMRDLLAQEARDVRAAEAVALFCYSAKKGIGAGTAALGGLDTLVFAGGIGENAAPVRARICSGLGYLGLELDAARNAAHAPVISTAASRVTVRVIRTDEECMIAGSVRQLLGAPSASETISS